MTGQMKKWRFDEQNNYPHLPRIPEWPFPGPSPMDEVVECIFLDRVPALYALALRHARELQAWRTANITLTFEGKPIVSMNRPV